MQIVPSLVCLTGIGTHPTSPSPCLSLSSHLLSLLWVTAAGLPASASSQPPTQPAHSRQQQTDSTFENIPFNMSHPSPAQPVQNSSMTPHFLCNGIQIPSPSGQSQEIPGADPSLFSPPSPYFLPVPLLQQGGSSLLSLYTAMSSPIRTSVPFPPILPALQRSIWSTPSCRKLSLRTPPSFALPSL